MLFEQREKSFLFFSLFSLISYLEKSREINEKRKVKSTKRKVAHLRVRLFFLCCTAKIDADYYFSSISIFFLASSSIATIIPKKAVSTGEKPFGKSVIKYAIPVTKLNMLKIKKK